MKGEEKQRKFHETLLKMLYPPQSPPLSDKEAEEETEFVLTKSLNGPPEEEFDHEAPSPPISDDDEGGNAGKMTRAQRKRLRKRKLKEAASRRRKIVGPLLPGSDEEGECSHGSVEDVLGDHSHGSSVEVVSNVVEGVGQNAAGEEASCSKKNKIKLKQRRKSKKMVVAKATPSSSTNNQY